MTVPELGQLNLDGMMPEDLTETALALQVLTDYASTKRLAMVLRSVGHPAALRLERELDELYQRLPSHWRW